MVAADCDRCAKDSARDEVVEGQTRDVAFAVTEPADPRRQSLPLHLLAGEADPALQRVVVGKGCEHGVVGGGEVGWVTGQAGPPERAGATAEQRPDVGKDEALVSERVRDTRDPSPPAQAAADVAHA